MGRAKTVWTDLPPRMTARRMPSGKILYYYQAARKKIPLGADKAAALTEWAKLEAGGEVPKTFLAISEDYKKTFRGLAVSTQEHYETAIVNLAKAFGAFSLEQLEPSDVKKYIRQRSAKGAALFEKRVLSAFFNWARGEGYTKVPNPCLGIKFSKTERKEFKSLGNRERYVTDAEYDSVWARADDFTQDAMDLALYTAQRPGDILKARRQDIREGVLWFVQEKTGTELGVRVEGDLERVLNRILARPREVESMYLLCDRRGQRVLYNSLNRRFLKARGESDWQFRDIRAKAASDSPDLKRAQKLLGHAKETTTTIYRRATDNIVSPLKRANSEPI